MTYFIIAGERSGDYYAADLVRQIKSRDDQATFVGWGGNFMEEAGVELLQHYKSYSIMGFWEVLSKLPFVREQLAACKQHVKERKPDVLILVDFPGFNLRIAEYAKKQGIATFYYISPKLWAWNASRIEKIKSYVDRMAVILPFEPPYFKSMGVEVTYVGHPLVSAMDSYLLDEALVQKLKAEGTNIAFLPGSRFQEVRQALKCIEKLSEVYDEYTFLVTAVDNIEETVYAPLIEIRNVKVIFNKPREVLKASQVAIVTSGTATLETALLGIPQVVVYRTSTLTYMLARMLAKVEYISLVNLILGRPLVKELIQGDYNPVDISAELEALLNEDVTKKRISEGYSEIRQLLGKENAASNAAAIAMKLAKKPVS